MFETGSKVALPSTRKGLTAAAPLPVPAPNRRTVVLTILPSAGGWFGLIETTPVSFEVSEGDIADLNNRIVEALENFRVLVNRRGDIALPPQSSEYREAAEQLRQAGSLAYTTIFADPRARSELERLDTTPLALSIYSQGFPLLWELLYSGPAEGPLDWKHFWGIRYVLGRRLVLSGVPNPRSTIRRPHSLILLSYDGLPYVREHEVPGLTRMAKAYHLQCSTLREVLSEYQSHRKISKQKLLSVLKEPAFDFDFIHFACHAYNSSDSALASQLVLTVGDQRLELGLDDLRLRGIRLSHGPLVFLNACATAQGKLLQTSSFPADLLRSGAMGVVATVCTIPDIFAAEFALAFYQAFFEGQELGSTLNDVRNNFLKAPFYNPLGLAYALYADTGVRIDW